MYITILVSTRHTYGKATIFNGIFESSNSGRLSTFPRESAGFAHPRFRVNQVFLTDVAAAYKLIGPSPQSRHICAAAPTRSYRARRGLVQIAVRPKPDQLQRFLVRHPVDEQEVRLDVAFAVPVPCAS